MEIDPIEGAMFVPDVGTRFQSKDTGSFCPPKMMVMDMKTGTVKRVNKMLFVRMISL